MKNFSINSHMLKHAVDMHEGEDTRLIDFRMNVLKFHRSSFERQISEAVSIQYTKEGNSLLNSRSEYNRSAVPRLALKMGSRNYSKNQKEGEEEEEKEKTIQEKIRHLRKIAGKRNNRGGRGDKNHDPAPKRWKLNEDNVYSEERKVEQLVVTEALGEKKNPKIVKWPKYQSHKDRESFNNIYDYL